MNDVLLEDITVKTKSEWINWARSRIKELLTTHHRFSVSSPDLLQIIIVDHQDRVSYRCTMEQES